MRSIKEIKATASKEIVARTDLIDDPRMQMRDEVNIERAEEYASEIVAILDEHPIQVINVTDALGESSYIVDGFHRYHAARIAGLNEINIEIMEGTLDEALMFSRCVNFTHGLNTSGGEKKAAINALRKYAPDFGYDSSRVVDWLNEICGINRNTAKNNSSDWINEIKQKRDAKIIELASKGVSNKKIMTQIGCGKGTVIKVLRGQKIPEVKTDPLAASVKDEAQSDDSSFDLFDDDDFDTTPAVNPQDSFKETIKQHDKEIADSTNDTIVVSNVSTNDNVILNEYLRELEAAAKAGELTDDQVMTLKHIASLV